MPSKERSRPLVCPRHRMREAMAIASGRDLVFPGASPALTSPAPDAGRLIHLSMGALPEEISTGFPQPTVSQRPIAVGRTTAVTWVRDWRFYQGQGHWISSALLQERCWRQSRPVQSTGQARTRAQVCPLCVSETVRDMIQLTTSWTGRIRITMPSLTD